MSHYLDGWQAYGQDLVWIPDQHVASTIKRCLVCMQVRVSRRRILDSAQKVMELYAASRVVLELEYFGEVGTGLGPTLEFYTLLAHELQVQGVG